MIASKTHLLLIPTYNTGAGRLLATVREALAQWRPVWVVVDGSTDGSHLAIEEMARNTDGLRVLTLERNHGKGGAVFEAARVAMAAGFTHALVMDADGQHPADRVAEFMETSRQKPRALVLGKPIFGPEAPLVRLKGRKLSVGLVHFELFGKAVEDPLFGFRVYPLDPLVKVMSRTSWARRYDFDPEVAVRMVWRGVPTLNVPAACRYLSREQGGVSHFHYVRDNARMVWLHTRLITELLLFRWICLLYHRIFSKS
ncbi:MAG: glycosyltransferase family 2 protein [Nibricoccus sp.]